MTDKQSDSIFHDVASPFCGIASDDLVVEVNGNTVTVKENGDPVTRHGFESPMTDLSPRIKGQEATLDEAVSHIAALLKNSKQPLIGGMGTDLNGARAAMALADISRATIDSQFSDAAFRNILVLQDSGYMTTTLTEVRNRVDLLLVVGTDIESSFPRFFERIIWPEESMFGQQVESREIIYLGKKPSGQASTSPGGRPAEVIECDDACLPEVMSVLRALVKGKKVQAETVGGIAAADLAGIAEKLKSAKYGVITWSGFQLNYAHAEVTIQNICEMIKEINHTTRCNGLPLGGKEGDTTVNAVSSWQSGYPMRTSFSRNMPDYDPYMNRGQRMLDEGEVDVLLWVSSFNTDGRPPATDATTVVLGRSGMTFDQEPEVFIPVGVPGIDHSGRTFRCDSVVSVPLKKLRDSGLPSTYDVLTAVEQAL
ncbi:formylmethanofuran dehydrogenase subunit B [Methylophaga sp.]|uniref:formylmethanofuran dehydrogenase subunit B n=1 Tax=Methylophaga sp. TaxID=2024840 RepID=UPI0013FE9BBD|nr:formylmethanofuran dehydrogenase subunit B [Methylophaga sp.]MTI62991.1 formylmethanofuran dehydrogenase subunit B [Methylophaga sp.]